MKEIIDRIFTSVDGRFNFFYLIVFVLVIGLISLVLLKSEFMMVTDDHYIFGYDYRECLRDCRVKPYSTDVGDRNLSSLINIDHLIRKEDIDGFIGSDSNHSR